MRDEALREKLLGRLSSEGTGAAGFYPCALNELPDLKERLDDGTHYRNAQMLSPEPHHPARPSRRHPGGARKDRADHASDHKGGFHTMSVRIATARDKEAWDEYVAANPRSTAWHLWGWREVIGKTYGHTPYYLLATGASGLEGVLPLFHVKSLLFGNTLVSMPFLDGGGLLADTDDAGRSLLAEAVSIAGRTGASAIELRHLDPPMWRGRPAPRRRSRPMVRSPSKVRMLLSLPGSSEAAGRLFQGKIEESDQEALEGRMPGRHRRHGAS